MFSISHSLLSIALPHVLLTVLISSTCTLLGTPSFPQYLSLSVSSCVGSFVLSFGQYGTKRQTRSGSFRTRQFVVRQAGLVCTVVYLSVSAQSYQAFSVLALSLSLSIYSRCPMSSSVLPLSVSKYPLPLQSPSALDPRLRHHLPGSDPRLPPTSTLPAPRNHAFVCPASTHACPTTIDPELPSTSLFADNDPCLSNHELPLIKPLFWNFLNLVWRLVPLSEIPDSCSKSIRVHRAPVGVNRWLSTICGYCLVEVRGQL